MKQSQAKAMIDNESLIDARPLLDKEPFIDKEPLIDNEHWLNIAQKCPSPNFNHRPEDEISLLVIHNISLPPKQYGGPFVQDFFCNRLDINADPYFAEIAHLQVSSHLFIRRDGTIAWQTSGLKFKAAFSHATVPSRRSRNTFATRSAERMPSCRTIRFPRPPGTIPT